MESKAVTGRASVRKKREKRRKKKIKRFFAGVGYFIVFIMLNAVFGIGSVRFGLFKNVRTTLVTTAMTTMSHQYIANIFADSKTIEQIMAANRVEDSNEKSVKSLIKIDNDSSAASAQTEPKKDDVTLTTVKGEGYTGYLLTITNPKRVKLAVTKGIGESGSYLKDLIKDNNAMAGTNAGGFVDTGGVGNGGTPTGIIVKGGQVIWRDKTASEYSLVGFDKDNVLVLGKYSSEQILDQIKKLNIVDAVAFTPYLIVNGKPTTIYGDGGWGIQPRTVIGQKEDGTVLLLIIDGRQAYSKGATIKEAQRVMIAYGAVNAANLDGGSSTVMYKDGKLINKPCSPYGERPLPTAFVVTN